jgi:hypothetical protein
MYCPIPELTLVLKRKELNIRFSFPVYAGLLKASDVFVEIERFATFHT